MQLLPGSVPLILFSFFFFFVSEPEKHAEQEFLSMIYLLGLGE